MKGLLKVLVKGRYGLVYEFAIEEGTELHLSIYLSTLDFLETKKEKTWFPGFKLYFDTEQPCMTWYSVPLTKHPPPWLNSQYATGYLNI